MRYLITTALLFFSAQAFSQTKLEIVAKLDQSVGNITFTPNQRVIFSHHPLFAPKVRVAELMKDGSIKPFPNESWNSETSNSNERFDNVLGLRATKDGTVWILDTAGRSKTTPKLVAWDTKKNTLKKIVYLPAPISTEHSFLNDFAVDEERNHIYIADEGIGNGGDGSLAGLIDVDLETGNARRPLDGHFSVLPESKPIIVGANRLKIQTSLGAKDLLVGADGIVADIKNEWLYYGPLNGTSLYRLKISDLVNKNMTRTELEKKVERYSDKPNNGGLSIDKNNNIYLTAMETNSIGIIGKDRKYRQLAAHEQMLWPDGVSYSPDGYMYVSAAQLHLVANFNRGVGENKPPYYIFRFKPLTTSQVGR